MTTVLTDEQVAALVRFIEKYGLEYREKRKLIWVPVGRWGTAYWRYNRVRT